MRLPLLRRERSETDAPTPHPAPSEVPPFGDWPRSGAGGGVAWGWTVSHAEAVIYLRAQALTDRWEEMLERVRRHAMRTRDLEWRWQATPMSFAPPETAQNKKRERVKGCAA